MPTSCLGKGIYKNYFVIQVQGVETYFIVFYSVEYFTIGNKPQQVDETDVTSNNYQTECRMTIEYGM